MLLLSLGAPRTAHARARPARSACASLAAGGADPLGLEQVRDELLQIVKGDAAVTDADRELISLFEESILPLQPAVYAGGLVADERKTSIQTLSKNLDIVEGVIRGPMLTGKSPSLSDVHLFPSMCLFHMTLPVHVREFDELYEVY